MKLGNLPLGPGLDADAEEAQPLVEACDVGLTARETVERLGGAGLAAMLRTAPDVRVQLIALIAGDDPAQRLLGLLHGVEVLPLGHQGATRTKIRLRAAGQCLVRLDEGGPGTPTEVPLEAVEQVLTEADVVLVSDYGAGTTRHPGIRSLLTKAAANVPLLWDPHPRGGDPVPGCLLVTPNLSEAGGAEGASPDGLAEDLRENWRVRAVCVTAGSNGAYLAQSGSQPLYVPAPPVSGGDPCGAGDRFAASAALSVARGQVLSESVVQAVTDASAWVAAGGTAAFAVAGAGAPVAEAVVAGNQRTSVGWEAVERRLESVRASGGRVVATGGCFDLLHIGHVSCLRAARRAGDALIVLLNSDASVRRLKGPERPVVTEGERAEVLAALECVDGVVVFDEDDPRAALGRLRPDVWVKGGDYGGAPMPEAELVRGWGGRVLLLPYLSGRSTTALLERAEQLEETR